MYSSKNVFLEIFQTPLKMRQQKTFREKNKVSPPRFYDPPPHPTPFYFYRCRFGTSLTHPSNWAIKSSRLPFVWKLKPPTTDKRLTRQRRGRSIKQKKANFVLFHTSISKMQIFCILFHTLISQMEMLYFYPLISEREINFHSIL